MIGGCVDSIEVMGLLAPASDAKVMARYREFEGLPDLDVSKAAKCAALCSSFQVALDIGAHVGAVSLYLARKFERVIAFEGVPATFHYLAHNVANVANVDARNVAVGGESGQVYFSHYPKHGQLSHISGVATAGTMNIGPIPLCTIDSLELSNVSFMKIDVEGTELAVVEGARETILKSRPLILIEQAGNDELHFGTVRNEASAYLESLGMIQHPDAPAMKNDRLYAFEA